MRRVMAVALCAALAVACGGGKRFGSEELLRFTESPGGEALGRSTPTPAPVVATAAPTQAPAATPTRAPAATPRPAQETFFDVTLTASSPYFAPGSQLVMPAGVTVRVTNEDRTPERPTRSFTAEDGSFDSGPLKPGQVWTHRFSSPGRWRVVDGVAAFIFATLEVR